MFYIPITPLGLCSSNKLKIPIDRVPRSLDSREQAGRCLTYGYRVVTFIAPRITGKLALGLVSHFIGIIQFILIFVRKLCTQVCYPLLERNPSIMMVNSPRGDVSWNFSIASVTVPRKTSSNFFVNSRATEIRRSPNTASASCRNTINRWGDS